MVKKYIDAEYILRAVEKSELTNYEKDCRNLMQEKPNFNHEKYVADKRIYQHEEFIILQVKSKNKIGYIAQNTKKPFEEGHTHLNSLNMAKTIINNVINKKRPKTNNIYLLESHIRLSEDEKYISYINGLIDIKRAGKCDYINRTSDKRR